MASGTPARSLLLRLHLVNDFAESVSIKTSIRRFKDAPATTRTITVRVSLKYGKGSVRLEIPKDRLLGVVKPRPSVRRGQSIPEALAAPVGTEPLTRLVDRNDKVAVVV
ncbi:DUF2088 domain-containing protein, partial [bacterium]